MNEANQKILQHLRIDPSQRAAAANARWSRRWIIGGIVMIALLSLFALLSRGPKAAEVEVTRAAGGSDSGVVLSASGYIVAHHKINVNSKVTGRVAWIGVEKGDQVKQGQLLVRLEDEEFRAQVEQARGAAEAAKAALAALQNGSRPEEIQRAQHDLDQARANAARNKITLERTRGLVAEGVLSKQALDDAEAQYNASQQLADSLERTFTLAKIGPRKEDIERARGQMIQAQGSLAYWQSQLDATLIKAPVSGTILERTAEKGELITAQFASAAEGGPVGSVVALADLKDIQVELDIAQDDFAKLSPKQKGVVTVDAFPDRKYDGEIAEISPEANRQKATVQVKVQILNPDSYLRPEMNSTVRFLAEDAGKVGGGVFVPATAVHAANGGKVVYVIENGKARARSINVASNRAGGFLVTGISDGTQVITSAPANLKDGDVVKLKK